MKVFLQADVEGIGLKGEMIKVSVGYGRNFLLPRGWAIEITPENEAFYLARAKKVEKRKEVIETKTSMLAEKISSTKLTIKKKMHDDGKLYGSITSGEIASALAEKGFIIAKNQVIIDKAIKSKGAYTVTIKLTSKLQPKVAVQVISE